MDIYITPHALDRARQRLGYSSKRRILDEAIAALIYGKRVNHKTFVHHETVWVFSFKLDALKTVYALATR